MLNEALVGGGCSIAIYAVLAEKVVESDVYGAKHLLHSALDVELRLHCLIATQTDLVASKSMKARFEVAHSLPMQNQSEVLLKLWASHLRRQMTSKCKVVLLFIQSLAESA